MKIKILFAWYDIWIGFFYDKGKNWIYFFPLPMVGIIIKLSKKETPEKLPNDVSDYISKSAAYLSGFVPDDKMDDVKTLLIKKVDKLLEKYD